MGTTRFEHFIEQTWKICVYDLATEQEFLVPVAGESTVLLKDKGFSVDYLTLAVLSIAAAIVVVWKKRTKK